MSITNRSGLFVAALVALGGCCLDATVTSGTGEVAVSTSGGRAGSAGSITNSSGTGGSSGASSGASGGVAGATGSNTGSGTGGNNGTSTGGCDATALTLSPNPINFGYVGLDATAYGCTTVSNACDAPITITGVGDFENAGESFQVGPMDDFPIVVEGDGNAQICFLLSPPITQQYTGQATLLTDNPSGSNPVVQLTGWGGGPEILCNPLTLSFSGVALGQSATQSISCTNIGTQIPAFNLTIGPLDAGPGPFSAAFQPGTYPADGLQPGQMALIDVTFAPTIQVRDFGVLAIPNNGDQGQTPYVSLAGNE